MQPRFPISLTATLSLAVAASACGGTLSMAGAGNTLPMDSTRAVAMAEQAVCGRVVAASDSTCVVVNYGYQDRNPVVTLDRNPPAGNDRVNVALKHNGKTVDVAQVPRPKR